MRQEIRNFTGGITDYVHTENVNAFEKLDNILITKDRNYISRLGSRLLGVEHVKPVTTVLECQRIAELNGRTYYVHGKQILEYDNGWTVLIGPVSDSLLTQGTINSTQSVVVWNDHLVLVDDEGSRAIKIYHDENGLTKVVQAGLPKPTTGTVTPFGAGTKGYVYSFAFKYDYKIGDVTFLDVSSVHNVQILNGHATQNDLSDLPVLTNVSDTLYDTVNSKLQIYRTPHEGTTSYLVAEVANGTLTYSDTTTDVDLVNGLVLYTTGTSPQNDLPPAAKFLEVVDNACFYGNTKDYPYRVWQSQAGDIDSVPVTFFEDFEEEIVGLSSFQSNLLVFTTNQIWRLEGSIDAGGAGVLRKVLIRDKIGCLGNNSIIKTDKGTLFAGNDSFYITNGYEANKIPEEALNFYNRYERLAVFPKTINGTYDRISQRAFWTTQSSASDYKVFVYDITFNAFTTFSGQDDNFDTTSILSTRKGELIRGDKSGHVFIHDNADFGDPIIDNSKAFADWQDAVVLYSVKHIDFDFGMPDLNKWVTKVTLTGDGRTSLNTEIRSYDNSYDVYKTLKEIDFTSGVIWEDESVVWGDHEIIWELEIRLSKTRRFRSGRIRTKTKQLEIANAISVLRESFLTEPDSQVIVDSTTKIATIIDPTLASFPFNSIGKLMVINGLEYEILDSTASTLTLSDIANSLVDGNQDWQVKGYAHNQQLHLSSIIYNFTPLDDDGGFYQEGAK